MLSSRGYVTNGVTTWKSAKMDGRKRLIEQEGVAPQVRFELIRLRFAGYRCEATAGSRHSSLGNRERAGADNPPVNSRMLCH